MKLVIKLLRLVFVENKYVLLKKTKKSCENKKVHTNTIFLKLFMHRHYLFYIIGKGCSELKLTRNLLKRLFPIKLIFGITLLELCFAEINVLQILRGVESC